MEMMEQILPVVGRLSMASPSSEVKNETPEPSLKKPWERRRNSPTFTEFAGSLAFESPETANKEKAKRRETIFEESLRLEKSAKYPTFRKAVPPFTGKLRSLEFNEINKFFKDLYAYQSEHDCYERGCPHIQWNVRAILCPPGVNDQLFSQIPNSELFALIRAKIRPNSQVEFRNTFVQNLKFHVRDNFILNSSTFREWCSFVKVYFREVQQRYEFLTEGLDKKLIPNIEDKENGLITLVLQRMVPYDAAKNIHGEFYFEFKNGKKNINLLDYLQGFQKHMNSYIQKARDSQALEAAIHTKEKYQTSNETIQKKT
jgi:hypothetical protein